MRDLTTDEVNEVSGGMSALEGGVAELGIGMGALGLGMAVAGPLGIVVGLGLLGYALYEEF